MAIGVRTDLGISLENGNWPGFPPGPALGRASSLAARPDIGFSDPPHLPPRTDDPFASVTMRGFWGAPTCLVLQDQDGQKRMIRFELSSSHLRVLRTARI